MGLEGAVEYVIGGVIAIFIITIFFTALAPSIIDTINNGGSSIGLPSATILIFTLIPLAVVVGIFMMFWRKINSPDQPPQYGGGY
jgi:hypothetical protein